MEGWRKLSAPGINGAQLSELDAELHNVKRLDESWPEDEFGNKLSLGDNIMWKIEKLMAPGDIELMGNADAIDPPREPQPGTYEFGERARQRRKRLQEERRPQDPEDVELTDVVSGEKQSLKKKRKEKEGYLDF
jgi:hypothetical protein